MEGNNAQAIIDVVQRLAKVEPVNVKTVPHAALVAVPKGFEIQSLKELLDEFLVKPERREGRAVLESVQAFCDYVNRFKNEDSVVFATEGGGSSPVLRGVIDHHQRGAKGEARFGRHIAAYDFPLSEQWQAWNAVDDKRMSQEDFAEFLEDRLLDVLDPADAGETARKFADSLTIKLATPAHLRDLSKGLSVRVNQQAAQKLNTTSGETTLSFSENHAEDDGTPLAVPGGFVLGIPVFHSGENYQLHARLRYRLVGRSVSWFVKLHRPDLIFLHAFNETVADVAKQTECHVFRGHPER